MKRYKFAAASAVLAALLACTSCSYNRPPAPEAGSEAGQIASLIPTHTITQLKELYRRGGVVITDDVVVEAVVASDDREGNLYKTCYLQDEGAGIELKLAMGAMSTLYPQGSRVYLRARGMTLGQYAGQINLGYRSQDAKYETAFLPEKLVRDVLLVRSRAEVAPKTLALSDLSPRYAGMLVRFYGVQFRQSELGRTYADPEHKTTARNVNRTLVDRAGQSIIVRTSSYARFAGRPLPEGSGSIVGILSYFRDTPQLLLLREADAQLSQPRF